MLIFDDIYTWEGWGGAFRLGSGRCRLIIFDLSKSDAKALLFLKPVVVIAMDLPKEKKSDMSVKSCNSHIATCVARDFNIPHQRMQFVEYYPSRCYGQANEHEIPEKFETVDFTWTGGKAIRPVYRDLEPPLLDVVKSMIDRSVPPPAA